MTARAIPQDPQHDTNSERGVWERLVAALPDDAVVLSGLRLTDETKDHEADLVLLLPGEGVVVVEVKGGSCSRDAKGRWWTTSGDGRRRIDPVRQARQTRYAIRDYVERDPRWRDSSRTRIRWSHAVVMPYTAIDDDFDTPDCPRWMIQGRGDQGDLADRLRAIPARASDKRAPTDDDVRLIVEILRGRRLPVEDVTAEADERASRADRLTVEQATLLGVTRLLNRVEVRGGAGSGKTVLALAQAKDLTRGRDDRAPQRVALLCYSIGLAEYFRRELKGLSRKRTPAFVGTFEELGRSWGAEGGTRQDGDFWERRLPDRMADLAAALPDGERFDAVIVDEAQDFADGWWRPLMNALRDEETGGLYVYTDENQRVFARFGRPPVPLVPLVLDHNLRNTRQIADVFAPLTPMRMRPMGGEGPAVRLVACAADEAVERADDVVEELLDRGWRQRDVALITTGARHPVQVERFDEHDPQAYWRSFWEDDDVFYGHVLGCKGLERRVVVLCVNEHEPRDRAKEKLYVGLSRATDELVVVGDPEVIRRTAGDAVIDRLGSL